MNLANKLTMLRIALIPFFIFFLLRDAVSEPLNRYIAVSIFIIAAITDALDGYIARSRNMITTFGKFMDPIADKLLVASALIAMVELKDLPAWVVIIMLSREFIISGFRLVAVSANVVISAGVMGKIKTIFQMIMIVAVLLDIDNPYYIIFSDLLIWASVAFSVLSAIEYIYKNIDVLGDLN